MQTLGTGYILYSMHNNMVRGGGGYAAWKKIKSEGVRGKNVKGEKKKEKMTS